MNYKDREYWKSIQEQEKSEEEARWRAKCELEDKLNSQKKHAWTEDEIKVLIQTNDKVLYGALKKLYECQTHDEQRLGETTLCNGVGFNGADAPILSNIAEFLIQKGFLSTKQKALVRKKLVKYNKQLTKLANA